MKKVKQGTKQQVIWRATCNTCGSVFEEEVGKLKVESDQREGEWAHANCPDCHKDMIFYPTSNLDWSEAMGQ